MQRIAVLTVFLMLYLKSLAFLSLVPWVTVMHFKHRHQGCSGGPGAHTPPSHCRRHSGPHYCFSLLNSSCQRCVSSPGKPWNSTVNTPGLSLSLSRPATAPSPLRFPLCDCGSPGKWSPRLARYTPPWYLGSLTQQIKTFWVPIIPSTHSFSVKTKVILSRFMYIYYAKTIVTLLGPSYQVQKTDM